MAATLQYPAAPPLGARHAHPALVTLASVDEADEPVLPVLVAHAGAPSGAGRALWSLIRRDGFEGAVSTLQWGRVWFQLDPALAEEPTPSTPGAAPRVGQPVPHPGYGWREARRPGEVLRALEQAEEAEGAWWYVLERHGMAVERRLGGQRRLVGFVPFEGDAPDWDVLDLGGQLAGPHPEVAR
jgi:hypothetical protein